MDDKEIYTEFMIKANTHPIIMLLFGMVYNELIPPERRGVYAKIMKSYIDYKEENNNE